MYLAGADVPHCPRPFLRPLLLGGAGVDAARPGGEDMEGRDVAAPGAAAPCAAL